MDLLQNNNRYLRLSLQENKFSNIFPALQNGEVANKFKF